MTDYDPHVSLDLHTTNGTRHAYHLTYSPPLHPGADPGIVDLLRKQWFPSVTKAGARQVRMGIQLLRQPRRRGGGRRAG